jgi:hypothetical protein
MLIWSMILIACFTGVDRLHVSEKEIVSVSVDETFAVPGSESVAIISVKVKVGYHIQANKVNDASLIPVSLRIIHNSPFNIGNAVFPPYKQFRLAGTERDLNVFDSLFIIRLPIKTSRNTKAGRYLIKAQLHYQACDAKTCLFPKTLDFELPVIVMLKTINH